jgi:prepilin signal peptidase PulO-like enzyme (type II secretory pathway)
MIIAVLVVLGLALGSFVNALVWRLHEQEKAPKNKDLSIIKGRSMCPHCKQGLSAMDLIPVASWLALKGKCRYCGKPISVQYPMVEAALAALFVLSYLYWPKEIEGAQVLAFGLWLLLLTGFMALTVYDWHWKLLPDKIMRPMAVIAVVFASVQAAAAYRPFMAVLNALLAVIAGGGIFYVLFQVSDGKWIGGGDVKLGALLGLIVGTPGKAVLVIFLASLLGTLASLPLLTSHKLKRNSTIPFGPFLIAGAIITQLLGHSILHWYTRSFLTL